MLFSTPDSYFKHDKHDIFMMFEEEMGKAFPTKSYQLFQTLEVMENG
jgi:hypothetical protein